MTLRAKLITAFLGFALLSMILGVVNLVSTQRTIETYNVIARVNAPALLALGQIKAATASMGEAAQAYTLIGIARGADAAQVSALLAEAEADIEDSKALVDEWIVQYRVAVQGEAGVLDRSTEISSAAASLYQQSRVMVELLRRGLLGANVLGAREQLTNEEDAFFYALDEVTNSHLQALADQQRLAQQASQDSIIISIGVIVGLVMFAIGAGLLLTRLIAAPILRLKDAAQSISAGKLDTRITLDTGDEIGVLANAFNQMVANLSGTLLRLDNIIGSMAEMLIVVDSNSTIQTVNAAALVTLGYRSEELVGQPMSMVLSNEADTLSDSKIMKLTRSGINRNLDTAFITKDGHKIPVAFSGSMIRDENSEVQGIVCVARDVTESRRAEQALLEQEAFLRQVIDLNPGFVFVKDWDGKYLLANQPTADLYGITIDELVGKYDADFNPHSDELEMFLQTDQEVMRSGEPMLIPQEMITYAETGETRWFQMTKVPLMAERLEDRRVLGISTDITARKSAEEAVREQEAFLRQVIDLIPGSIFVKDWDGRFVLSNKALADLYGTALSDIVGRTDADFNPNADEVAQYIEADREVMRSGQPKFIQEETITNAVTGKVRWYQTAKVPLMAEALEDRRVIGVAIDITERKHAETEREFLITDLKFANERALESSRLKSEFVSTMSHELRTPLNAVIGFAGIMLEGMAGKIDDNARYMVQGIYNSSQSLLGLINDILDISKIEAGRLEIISEPVNTLRLVNQWQTQMGVLARQKGIDFQIDISPEVPEIFYGDEGRITQVTTNLLSNAFKFTANGTVRLEIAWEDDALFIRVIDTGIGIAPHALTYIFDEFRQVDATSQRKYGGTGLGLAIVRKLCNLMGGNVNVESALGAGSIFTVTLPLRAVTPA